MIEIKSLNREIEDFKTKQIQIVPGLLFNQYETIIQNYFYYNSKFQTGEVDEDGDRKYFLNINKNPCKVFSKSIDFDTKNIRMLTTGGGDPLKTWFMERDLKFWMRDKQFGRVLNRLFKELPIFGTVVLKIVSGEPMFVDLRNFVLEQQADTLEQSNYIIEIHNYTPAEFRKIGKQMKWSPELINKTINEFRKMKNTSHVRVYERYGETEDTEKGVPTGVWSYKRIFFADVGIDEYDQMNQLSAPKQGVLLSEEEWTPEQTSNLYWEFHAEKMGGRWLGIGVVESLTEPQIRENEIANLQSKTSYWSALRLFFSQDPKMAGNLLTEKKNGEVVTGDAPITQIDMSDRNLAFFTQESQKWMANRDELTFSYDVVQGERLPAGTPLGSAQMAVTQTLSYFEGIQEEIALAVKEMIYKVIIPQFEKESNSEHTLRLVGKDLDKYVEMVKNQMVFMEVTRLALLSLTGKPFPTNSDADAIGIAIEETIKQGKEKILTIPKGFYKDIKYDIDIDITGESIDTRVRQATIFAVLQAVTADPSMTQDPIKRKILYMMMENGGISPDDIFDTPKKGVSEVAQQMGGGGVSAPAMGAKLPGLSSSTV
jgi:hypothetical protein